jgi:hypothetical protein
MPGQSASCRYPFLFSLGGPEKKKRKKKKEKRKKKKEKRKREKEKKRKREKEKKRKKKTRAREKKISLSGSSDDKPNMEALLISSLANLVFRDALSAEKLMSRDVQVAKEELASGYKGLKEWSSRGFQGFVKEIQDIKKRGLRLPSEFVSVALLVFVACLVLSFEYASATKQTRAVRSATIALHGQSFFVYFFCLLMFVYFFDKLSRTFEKPGSGVLLLLWVFRVVFYGVFCMIFLIALVNLFLTVISLLVTRRLALDSAEDPPQHSRDLFDGRYGPPGIDITPAREALNTVLTVPGLYVYKASMSSESWLLWSGSFLYTGRLAYKKLKRYVSNESCELPFSSQPNMLSRESYKLVLLTNKRERFALSFGGKCYWVLAKAYFSEPAENYTWLESLKSVAGGIIACDLNFFRVLVGLFFLPSELMFQSALYDADLVSFEKSPTTCGFFSENGFYCTAEQRTAFHDFLAGRRLDDAGNYADRVWKRALLEAFAQNKDAIQALKEKASSGFLCNSGIAAWVKIECNTWDVSKIESLVGEAIYAGIESSAKEIIEGEDVFETDENGIPVGLKFRYIFSNQAAFARAGYDVSVIQTAVSKGRNYLTEEEADLFSAGVYDVANNGICANRKISSGGFSLSGDDVEIKPS